MSRSSVRAPSPSSRADVYRLTTFAAEAESRPKSAHRYNVAEQQQIYKSEIERIWKAQFDSLSRKDEPELTAEERAAGRETDKDNKRMQRRQSMGYTPAHSPPETPGALGPISPTYSRGSSLAREREMSLGPDAQRRVLRIKRFVDGEWKLEIVRDPSVITAYLKKRQAIEEENMTADALAPTGDAERDRRARKRYGVLVVRCLAMIANASAGSRRRLHG